MNAKRRSVNYEMFLLTYIDILGFQELIATKTANDISRAIRVVRETVEPRRFKTGVPELPQEEFLNFSDLCIVWTPLARKGSLPPMGEVHSQILHMVHVQTNLLFDQGILVRGGITVGDVAKSYGQLFGPAVVRGYKLENEVARFPRIVVGEEVLDLLKKYPALWVHDRQTDMSATRHLLRRDFDGEFFVDYLRVIEEELDERGEYPALLDQHEEFINERLAQYKGNASILPKYKWLKEYHRHTVKRWKARKS